MKKLAMLLRVVIFFLLLTACGQSIPPNVDTTPIENAIENTVPAGDTQDDSQETEPLTESDSLAYPWMMPEVDHLGYEEFFAEEREYDVFPAVVYSSRIMYSEWYIGESGSRIRYGLKSDEDGLYIYRDSHRNGPCYRIPNTEDLTDYSVFTNTRELFCVVGGKLLRVDMLTGERNTLYTAEYIPNIVLCTDGVLYFLAISDGILSLNRLYVPTLTLDLLYAQVAPEERYAAQFENNGHPAHPARVALGALIIKRRLKCSDEWTVRHISENPFVRPIVRGKARAGTEFGAKLHIILESV